MVGGCSSLIITVISATFSRIDLNASRLSMNDTWSEFASWKSDSYKISVFACFCHMMNLLFLKSSEFSP